MKFYTGIPFPGLWKRCWLLLQRINTHRSATVVALLCLGLGSFMGLSHGFHTGFLQSNSSGAVLGMVSGITILDRLEQGDMDQVERMANTLLDISVQDFYENGGPPQQPWFLRLQYRLRGWGSMIHATSAYQSALGQIAEYRKIHPSDYLQGNEELNHWLMSYLPKETSASESDHLDSMQPDTVSP